MRFMNRKEAGKELARALAAYKGKSDTIVYALPRGGVVTGYEVAAYLKAPLELTIVRKVGHPESPEYAICAVTENGGVVCNESERALADKRWLAAAIKREQNEAKRRRITYLQGRTPITPEGKTAIVVDDGVATGLTMLIAVRELKNQGPKKVVVAVPVVPADTAARLRDEADEIVSLETPIDFLGAIGSYYQEFPQVDDDEVIALISR